MDTAADPVAPDEFVLRRVAKDYYQANLPIPIQWVAFKPWPRDATGLSVYRERSVRAERIVASVIASKRGDLCIARLSVRDLLALGLTVVPEEADLLGHAVIRELRFENYQRDKKRFREVLVELARIASRDIIYRPPA